MGPNDEAKTMSLDEMAQREVEPIVDEKAFPEKSQRMQELVEKYRKEQGVSETQTTVSERKTFTATSVVLKTQTYETLSEQNQERVNERIKNIDYMVSNDILTFGSAKESPLTKNAEEIIRNCTTSELGDISDSLAELVSSIKSNSPMDVVKDNPTHKGKWGFLEALIEMISLKKAKKKLYKMIAEHQTILQNIQAVEVILEKQRKGLSSDIKKYEQMSKDTYVQIWDFELDSIALQLLSDAANKELDKYKAQGELDLLEADIANSISDAISRIERRQDAIKTSRIITIQSLPQLRVLIKGDEIIIEKIDEVESLVIPMWKWQFAIAIGAVRQREAISIQKAVRGITSHLLKKNAQVLHDNMIAAYQELHAAAVAVEDLFIVQGYLDDMVTKVTEIGKDAKQQTIQRVQAYEELESRNISLMTTQLMEN